MLKSICIKTNNKNIIDYLLNELEKFNINCMYVSKLNFSKFTNIIVHYKGKNTKCFINKISDTLSTSIIKFYEQKILKHLITNNYFYFTAIEQEKILEICKNNLDDSNTQNSSTRKDLITHSIANYFLNKKSVVLNGFVNFRLKDYFNTLDSILDSSVNKFIIDREYIEFINLLKTYVNSKPYGLNLVHLIYNNQESILLDEFKDTITLDNSVLNAKYISDISFSSNDYALNNLLTLLPKKIYIHLANRCEDDFINTLKLIFNDRIFICKDCDICRIYSISNS